MLPPRAVCLDIIAAVVMDFPSGPEIAPAKEG